MFRHSFLSTNFRDLILSKPRDIILCSDNGFCNHSSLLPYLAVENKFQSSRQLTKNHISIFHNEKP